LYEDLSKHELSRTQPLRLIDAAQVEANFVEPVASNSFAMSGTRDEQFIGQFIGSRYRLDKILGSGGMSVVFLAFDVKLQRSLAVKLIHAHLHFDNRYLQRFQQEGKTLSKLDHPNIVKVFEYGLHAGTMPYMVMEYLEGTTLASELSKHTKLSIESTIDIAIQVCGALNHAHRVRVIHRDLKPSNIMIRTTESGAETVKIVDFGIAKIATETHSMMTGTGEVFGSPVYMSPEQCEGLATDGRTDLYSLGCVIYESLAGTPPFVGDSPLATMMKHQKEQPVSLLEASLGEIFPKELERCVQKLLAKAPDDRYASAADLAKDLANIREHGYAAVPLETMAGNAGSDMRKQFDDAINRGAASREAVSRQAERTKVSAHLGIFVYAGIGSFIFILMGAIVFLLSSSGRFAADDSQNPRKSKAEKISADSQKSEQSHGARKFEKVDQNSDISEFRHFDRRTANWAKVISDDPRALKLAATPLSNDWRLLSRLKNLMAIDFSSTDFEARDIAYLKDLPLREVDFTGLKVASGLAGLEDVKTLQTLILTNSGVHDNDLPRINVRIRELSLAGCPITDDGLRSLLRLKSLKSLDLHSTIINDRSIKYLSQMKLESLNVEQTQLTNDGIATLKKLLPGCVIYNDIALL
jgi:serine/threonine protein kinase